ncbi:MAG: aminofutalosine synthase MqnE [Prevotellaceae bacterium]|jgi:aminodeoxyfutalosine synthase|nr:aminofutalosine synthase MqnE [Prevotellaceae bacterium]
MSLQYLIDHSGISGELKAIAGKIMVGERLNPKEGLTLYHSNNLSYLGILATYRKRQASGDKVYFNRNFHIEPTNICLYNCKFCSYRRNPGEAGVWDYSMDEMLDIARSYTDKGITEVHIVGGVHPQHDLHFFGELVREIKKILPQTHIKGFTAVELDYMIRKSGYTLDEGLQKLKDYGLDSIPGGGAEIFNEKIREQICGQKLSSQLWLDVHEAAHRLGIPSNATILYGHIETYEHRIDHLNRLRNLQDSTKGFNAFIPLKYKNANNSMHSIGEVSTLEVLKNFAVTRLFLDNVPHIKSYWPMLGKQTAQLALAFGADDVDGTIDDTTKIYSMAGSEELSPNMDTNDMVNMIQSAGFTPIERDSCYNELKVF